MNTYLYCILMMLIFLPTPSLSHGDDEISTETLQGNAQAMLNEYSRIFYRSNNRNAASHRWANWIFNKALTYTHEEFVDLFRYFCAVSGSPISSPDARGSYKVTLPQVGSTEEKSGAYYVCCSPCVCDTDDFIKVAQKEVELKNGDKHTYDFLVLADPCPHSTTTKGIPPQAGDVYCTSDNKLEDAVYIDDTEFYIIGMLFPETDDGSMRDSYGSNGVMAPGGYCEQRAAADYPSGMGKIFRDIAELNPLNVRNADTSVSTGTNDEVVQPETDPNSHLVGFEKDMADSVSCSGPDMTNLLTAVQNNKVLMSGAVTQSGGMYNCQKVGEKWLKSKSICYEKFDLTNEEWGYLKCLYPNEIVSGMMMHSYLFVDQQMIGNGFVVRDETLTNNALNSANALKTCVVDKTEECEAYMKIDDVYTAELESIKNAIATQKVSLFGWEPCSCVSTAINRFKTKNVCYTDNIWRDFEDPKMKYFNCMYGEQHHSFIFFMEYKEDGTKLGGKFIGNGFELAPNHMSEEVFEGYLQSSYAVRECAGTQDKNLHGGELQSCSQGDDGLTGWTRSGSCVWETSDSGYHQVCVKMSNTFLESSKTYDANDLSSVVNEGGHWCICAWAFASAVSRDPVNYEGIELDCDRTNGRLRNVYQSFIDAQKMLTSPSGAMYRAQDALDQVNNICGEGTFDDTHGDMPTHDVSLSESVTESPTNVITQTEEVKDTEQPTENIALLSTELPVRETEAETEVKDTEQNTENIAENTNLLSTELPVRETEAETETETETETERVTNAPVIPEFPVVQNTDTPVMQAYGDNNASSNMQWLMIHIICMTLYFLVI